MDDATVVVLVAGVILFLIAHRLTAGPSASPTTKESKDGATIEKCPRCHGIVGVSVKGTVSMRLSNKDKCPHCGQKIKR